MRVFRQFQFGLVAILLSLACGEPVKASDTDIDAQSTKPAGLMWNRTGLPAVFPLQVKTRPERDYFMTLVHATTGEDALAAYITGGAFFRVLVPPGTFHLVFASGTTWKGEDALFGPGALTHIFELDQALTFEIRNPGIKAGHIVDITDVAPGQEAQVLQKPQLICQSLRIEHSLSRYPGYRLRVTGTEMERRFELPWYERPRDNGDVLFHLSDHPYRFAPDQAEPFYKVRARYCG